MTSLIFSIQSANMFYDQFAEDLEKLLSLDLPGEEAHFELLPLNRKPNSLLIDDAHNYRKSAVAIYLFRSDTEVHSLLIQRPPYEGKHGGQISFPGGKVEDEDPDLEYTARRESFEEINIPIDAGVSIGMLSEVFIPVSKFRVQPFIFFLEELPKVQPDPREVDEIITFNISHLLKNDIIRKTDLNLGNGLIRKDIPYFDIDGRIVWGATAMILSELKAVLNKL